MLRPLHWLAAAALATTAGPARAGFITESEAAGQSANNTVGTAQSVSGAFGGPRPADVFAVAGNFSHATVSGLGGGTDVDFYRFTTLGGRAYFDVDNAPFTFDTVLSLFDANGTLIALDDDSFDFNGVLPPDPGTEFEVDAFLGVVTLAPGTYTLAVSAFPNFPNSAFAAGTVFTGLTRPDGAYGGDAIGGAAVGDSSFESNGPQSANALGYTLQLSVENAVATPAPAGVLVLAAGAGLLAAARRSARRHP